MHCQFASDNTAGICPEAWEAIAAANAGSVPSYGDDAYTAHAAELFRRTFEIDCDVYFVFNGTAANSLALAAMCQSYHSIIAHEMSHVETDECGAPEFYSNGAKLFTAGGEGGKLAPESVDALVRRRSDIHFPKPRVVSITQSTELGTLYSLDEIRAISSVARTHGLRVHMDGARFSNAVAALGVPPRAITWEAGVDVLCFGGTKAGIGMSEAVVFFNRELSAEFDFRCKQAGQLSSKMRFMTAPWARVLEDGSWLRHAEHANAMAQRLATRLSAAPGVHLIRPVEANAVFVDLPAEAVARLRQRDWKFYTFIGGGVRLMCSWATTPDDIDRFTADMAP